MQDYIEIKGARVHNLKNISIKIPKNKLVVFTGVSGSGKSSLAFDTLYAEGQRRYVESLSSYARQFLGLMEKPDVDSITGLSPAISIDQKTSGSNPRSTVGTVTEIYDYMRLLFGQVGHTYCPNCGSPVKAQTVQEIINQIVQKTAESEDKIKVQILAPIVQGKKGTYNDLFESLLSKGFLRVRIDGTVHSLEETSDIKLDKNKKHNIDLIVDRLVAPDKEYIQNKTEEFKEFEKRLTDAVEISINQASGEIKVLFGEEEHFYSENNTCFKCKISFPQIKPASFSFNSPHGACPKCSGIGSIKEIDIQQIYNPKLSILQGGIYPWSNQTTTNSWKQKELEALAKHHKFDLKEPIGKYPEHIFNLIFYGTGAENLYKIHINTKLGDERSYSIKYEGAIPELERRYKETTSDYMREEIEKYMDEKVCSECQGKRLRPYSLAVRVGEKNIDDIVNMQIQETLDFFENLKLKGMEAEIAKTINREIMMRLKFLSDVGLDYLTLSRRANTLSGGESQRIRLASQIGTGLTGVLYILDEPSIGLHSRDVSKLITTLVHLKDLGNSVVVVEHDYDTIMQADWIAEIGPGAGTNGGDIVAEGDIQSFLQSNSTTARYLKGSQKIGQDLDETTEIYSPKKNNKSIKILQARTNNLKSVDITIPLGKFVCVTGVSGSGKSSLISDTLYPALMTRIMKSKTKEGLYQNLEGTENINKIISIDQSPIGRTPRSNPVTYTGVFNYIRDIFVQTPEARARGYKPGRFSFNVKGGRCEKCRGDGQIKIEMQFLPDMYVMCEVCKGKRYNKDILQIDYKGKNISDVLDMTVSEALVFFENISPIKRKLGLLDEVGLGYITLGQSATTLSGGESQRIKLAKELSKMVRGHTVYILDEPTTGLHFSDVDKLLKVLKRLVGIGHTVITVEHNLDIIKFANWIIDMGPEGGDKGGYLVAEGTLEDIINCKESYTGKYLKEYLEKKN